MVTPLWCHRAKRELGRSGVMWFVPGLMGPESRPSCVMTPLTACRARMATDCAHILILVRRRRRVS